MSGDPRRQIGSGGGSDVLRVALEAARRDAPDRAQLARLAARLPLHLPDGPGGGQGPGGPAEGGGPATGGGAGAPATGAGAGAPATGVGAGAPAAIASTAAVAPPSVLSGLGIGAALGVVLVGAVWLMPSPSQPPPAAPLAPPAAPLGPAVVATAAPAEAATAPAAEAPEMPAEVPSAAKRPRAPAPGPPRAPAGAPLPARASASTAGAPAAGGAAQAALHDAETELGLLQRAQEALAARPAEALALADAHLARFPGGALAQEREVIAVGALKALGRGGEALARANRFVEAHPSSAYRRRLEILVPELRDAQR
ncbi:hypothetical protein WME76_29075 [Sorangium sp. So ce119]|uniref:hypothetical protein n=1 Tax=Sorangium sp. So ce119 TaxID=3133279 RepID=UPI003F605EF4